MVRLYLIYGIIICVLFVAAGSRGFVVTSIMKAAPGSPMGRAVHK